MLHEQLKCATTKTTLCSKRPANFIAKAPAKHPLCTPKTPTNPPSNVQKCIPSKSVQRGIEIYNATTVFCAMRPRDVIFVCSGLHKISKNMHIICPFS